MNVFLPHYLFKGNQLTIGGSHTVNCEVYFEPGVAISENVSYLSVRGGEGRNLFRNTVPLMYEIHPTCAGGLNYTVAEGGANFSVGQRQLLCLVRSDLQNHTLIRT